MSAQRSRGHTRFPFEIREPRRARSEECLKKDPLAAHSKRGDEGTIFPREQFRRVPMHLTPIPIRNHEAFVFQRIEVIPDCAQRKVEARRNRAEMKPRLPREECENPITRAQCGLGQVTTLSPRETQSRTSSSRPHRPRTRATLPDTDRAGRRYPDT